MGRTLSQDLRSRVIAAVDGGMSRNAAGRALWDFDRDRRPLGACVARDWRCDRLSQGR